MSDGAADDSDLVRRCLSGDAGAQQRLVERYTPLVWSLCLRGGLPRAEAEDVCQEVFVGAFAALPKYRGECRLSTWLYTVAKRRIVDYRRSPARRQVPSGSPSDPEFPPLPASPSSTPESQAGGAERGARVRDALDGMTEPMRSILIAYYLGEVPVLDIARDMSLPEGTVKTHLHRGRQALRETLRDLC